MKSIQVLFRWFAVAAAALTLVFAASSNPKIPKYKYCFMPMMLQKADGVTLMFLYVAPESSAADIDKYLAQAPSAGKWRLATTEEAERFEQQFGGKQTAFEKESPAVAAKMKRLVVAKSGGRAR